MFEQKPYQICLNIDLCSRHCFFFFKAALGEHVKGREGAWSKGPSLPYSLVVCRTSVAEKASWELVCHLNLLLSTGIQVFFYNTGGAWQRLKNYFNSACKKFFHFWKALSCLFFWGGGGELDVLAVLSTGFGETVIFQLFVMGCEDLNCLYKHCHYFPRGSIIQDQAAEVTFTGMSACDLKEKLDCLTEIQQGKYKIVHLS